MLTETQVKPKTSEGEWIYVIVTNFKGCTNTVRASKLKGKADNIRKEEARQLLFTAENENKETGDFSDGESDVTLHFVKLE